MNKKRPSNKMIIKLKIMSIKNIKKESENKIRFFPFKK